MDRNAEAVPAMTKQAQSLSARRAWIEMRGPRLRLALAPVALRKESVDRNAEKPSISATSETVALRKESVDRNNSLESKQIDPSGRSPQGERG